MSDDKRRLFIIDGHSQIFRAYYARGGGHFTSPSGEPTNATYIFMTMLFNLIKRHKPDYLVMTLDTARSELKRTEFFPEYKANRDAPPEDLLPQVKRIEELVRQMDIPVWSGRGFEADDYLASAAARLASDDMQVVMVSRDKDLDQALAVNVCMFDPSKDEFIDSDKLLSDKGYTPDKAIEIQCLTGDSTDNIPGVVGIGPKTAVKLIDKYGTADEVIAHADELTPKQRENVLAFAEQLPITRKLVTLDTNAPLPDDLESCKFAGINADALREPFEQLGFKNLLKQLDTISGIPSDGGGAGSSDESQSQGEDASAAEVENTPPTTADDFSYTLVDTTDKLDKMLADISGAEILAVDTETTSTKPMFAELVGISIAKEATHGWYIPVAGPMMATVLDIDILNEKLSPILSDSNVKKVGHNLKYDAIVLRNAGLPFEGIYFDTYLAVYLLDFGRPASLDDVALRELNHRCIPISDLIGKGKNALQMDQLPTEDVAKYAAEDAYVSFALAEKLAKRLDAQELRKLFDTLEMPLLEVLAKMEMTGVRVDPQVLKLQAQKLDKQADKLRDDILEMAGEPFNPDSPKQLAYILFDKLGLPVQKKTKTGPSTDAEVLEQLAVRPDGQLPAAILEYRKLTKLLSTYLKALGECIHRRTGRIHASFNQGGTATGRLSSSDPNLQNIPIRSEAGRQIRSAFVAGGDDMILVAADYSQIELRMLAHFCGDETMRAAFASGEDIHSTVAAEVFGVSVDEVTPDQRARAKTVNFGVVYGQTAHGLSGTLGISRGEAQDFIDRYNLRFPSIKEYIAECVEFAKSHGYVQTIMGRRREVPEIRSRNAARRQASERMAFNTIVQGSAADLIKLAMINIHNRITDEKLPCKMLLQIHDELVFETPKDALNATMEMIRREMENAMELEVKLKVDIGSGPNWMDAK